MVDTFTNLSIINLEETTFIGGTYKEISFDVYDKSGNPVNIATGFNCYWALSPVGEPDSVALYKTCTVRTDLSATTNRFTVYIQSDDTINLSGKYIQQPILGGNPGYEFRMGQGYINIIPASGFITASNYTNFTAQAASQALSISALSASAVNASGSLTGLSASAVNASGSLTGLSASAVNTSASLTKISASIISLFEENNTGWITGSGTGAWSYLSASAITVPSDATTWLSIGDKVRLVQSAVTKYFYIIGVSATVLQVTGGTSYAVTNDVISGVYYSKELTPYGWSSGSLAWNGTTGMYPGGFSAIAAENSNFIITGRKLDLFIHFSGTSNAATTTGSLPVVPFYSMNAPVYVVNNTSSTAWGLATSASPSKIVNFFTSASNAGAWTTSNTKGVFGILSYQI